MKRIIKYISLTLIVIIFFGCKEAYEKENSEIDSLNQLVNNTEEVLLSIDTAKVFSVVRDVKKELWNFGNRFDTLDRETTFKVADYYGNKKSLYFIYDNYPKFIYEIEVTRKQLDNLKDDLNNGIIPKEKFVDYYKNEQEIIVTLNDKINTAVNGIDISVDKLLKGKAEIMEMLSKYRKDSLMVNE